MNKGHKFKVHLPKNYVKKCSLIHTQIDYLRVNSKKLHTHYHAIIGKINNYTNSNVYYDDVYTYQLANLSMGRALIISTVFKNKAVPIMLYNEFDDKTQTITGLKSRIDFYGLYFRLQLVNGNTIEQTIANIKDTLLGGEFQGLDDRNISRLDVATDFFFKTGTTLPPIKRCVKEIKTEHYEHYSGTGSLSSWSLGSKENLGVFYRGYDKNLDTLSKGKGFLYADYLQYSSVHRYELQFGSRYLSNIGWSELVSKIQEVNTAMVSSWSPLGSHLLGTFYEYHEVAHDTFEVNTYAKDIAGRCTTYALNGYNPLMMLHDLLPARLPARIFTQIVDEYQAHLARVSSINRKKTDVNSLTPSVTV